MIFEGRPVLATTSRLRMMKGAFRCCISSVAAGAEGGQDGAGPTIHRVGVETLGGIELLVEEDFTIFRLTGRGLGH